MSKEKAGLAGVGVALILSGAALVERGSTEAGALLVAVGVALVILAKYLKSG